MPLTPLTTHAAVAERHRKWLAAFPAEHLERWESLLLANEEAAVCESCVREVLQRHVDLVEPAEDPSTGGPDFRCVSKGKVFYVESTCLSADAVSKATHLSPGLDLDPRPRSYGDLTRLIRATASGKAHQIRDLDAPCLLAVGTFHFEGSGLCGDELHVQNVLTSTTGMSMNFDPVRGEAVGEMTPTTDLRASTVLRRGKTELVEAVRRTVSGLLVCGFGCDRWREGSPVLGVLHPSAARPFPRELLPNIRFCRLEPIYEDGVLSVRWD